MGFTRESNFPNSRITAGIQASDHANPANLLKIEGANVVVPGDPVPVPALYVQFPGGATGADINIYKVGGQVVGQLADATVLKFYDHMVPTYAALTDTWDLYKGAAIPANKVATKVITYADATKEVPTDITVTNI